MESQKFLVLLVQVLLILGGLNWASVAYNGTDVVALATNGNADIVKYTRFAIGASAAYQAYMLYLTL